MLRIRFEPWPPSLSTVLPVRSRCSVRRGCEHVFVSRRITLPKRSFERRSPRLGPAQRCCGRLGCDPPAATTLRSRSTSRCGGSARRTSTRMRSGVRFSSRSPIPLSQILVEHSTYHRGHLKRRLYCGGDQAAGLRDLRPGRDVARASACADPRPRQRSAARQSARESADRLPELRCNIRHALRPQESPVTELPPLRRRFRPSDLEPAVLLGTVGRAVDAQSRRRTSCAGASSGRRTST